MTTSRLTSLKTARWRPKAAMLAATTTRPRPGRHPRIRQRSAGDGADHHKCDLLQRVGCWQHHPAGDDQWKWLRRPPQPVASR